MRFCRLCYLHGVRILRSLQKINADEQLRWYRGKTENEKLGGTRKFLVGYKIVRNGDNDVWTGRGFCDKIPLQQMFVFSITEACCIATVVNAARCGNTSIGLM
ncbi:hypothetical protein KP79_PYT12436 [Mizuhopecten yessoensis]|uniref:Uncharacterized protein n=1 Tax=Mizuhopecten yessoensis TaxID=6573 RepID=A0A210QJJ9_MIZYE|nr:hypothetical protein KP79_PYT12436 [Mizuhopecten yessoensis]